MSSDSQVKTEKHGFEAEIKQLLDILVNSLYTHKDVFLREAISNASDALAKVRFETLTRDDILDKDAELAIWLDINEEDKTLTIKDTGIGMTKEELIKNLGTIAHSGTREFLAQVGKDPSRIQEVIGQFGVGFYSLFMVADTVTVRTKSYIIDEPAYEWVSDGQTEYEIRPIDKKDRGTEVIIKFKESETQFLNKYEIKAIVKKYSDFIEFPIYLEGEVINSREAIWRKIPKDVTEEEHKNFYQHLSQSFDTPLLTIHFKIDTPIQFSCLVYIPRTKSRLFFFPQAEWGLRLYSKKVLIQEHSKDVLPEYFRFVYGVVDSESLPLNISRETVQVDRELAKIKDIVTKRIIKRLTQFAKKNPEEYLEFWKEHGIFIKEGVTSDIVHREKLMPLLRFHSNKTADDEFISLDQYVERMKEGQKEIYYLIADSLEIARSSPHLEYYEENGYEVLLLVEPVDSFLMTNIPKYKEYSFKIIDQSDADLEEETETDDKEKKESKEKTELETEFGPLLEHLNNLLKDKVVKVMLSQHLAGSPVRLVTPKTSLRTDMERVYKFFDEKYVPQKKILEINPKNEIIQKMNELVKANKSLDLVDLTAEQLFTNALMLEGGKPDIPSMVSRVETLLKKVISTEALE